MLLAVQRDRHTLKCLPTPYVADHGAGRGFILLLSELSLRPERGGDRVWVAIRHLSPIDAFQHPQSLA
jgi:hypothetical protein